MVRKKASGQSQVERFLEADQGVRKVFSHLHGWFAEEDDFRELRVVSRPDGTMLAIAKGLDAAGGEVICFGSGYGVVGALFAVDRTIQAGHWKVDKPWPNGSK